MGRLPDEGMLLYVSTCLWLITQTDSQLTYALLLRLEFEIYFILYHKILFKSFDDLCYICMYSNNCCVTRILI